MKKAVLQINRSTNWRSLSALANWVIEEGIRVQQVAAPTFQEDERATYVAMQFRELGLVEVQQDEQKNVYGLLKGINRAIPALMVSAHTDTVFPGETDLTIQRKEGVIYGPGLGDNSMGVSGMLGLARWFRDENITPECDIWFVATSCEEGLGDLNGMRAAYEKLKHQVGTVINLEGLAFGHIYHAGIAVHRLHITARAEGGHSWLHFGRPSAVHAILELGAQINRMPVPTAPRSTFNVGMIEGGQAINAIGTSAGLWLDLRSEDQEALENMREQVYGIMRGLEVPGLSFEVEVVGNRPAGMIDPSHPLVEGAQAVLDQLNIRGTLERGSTDGNIPLHDGCPTVTIGITRGGNAHRLDEYIETMPVRMGMRQLIMLTLAAAQSLREDNEKAAGD